MEKNHKQVNTIPHPYSNKISDEEIEYNLGEYYLKLSLKNKNELAIIGYNIELLDTRRYENHLDINAMYKINNVFKIYPSIGEVYKMINRFISQKKYEISTKNGEIILSIIVDILNDNNKVNIPLSYKNVNTNDEYIKILSEEIKKLKGSNNNLADINLELNMLKEENNSIKNEISLLKKMITNKNISNANSHNNTFTNFSRSTYSEQKDESNHIYKNKPYSTSTNKNKNTFLAINEFNKTFNTSIIDTQIKKLDLRDKNLGKGKINKLNLVEFNQLQILWLNNNNISDISVLEKAKFIRLKELSLFDNNISDISVFEKVKFLQLEGLNLNNNKISNIDVFERCKFNNLLGLGLDNNNISDISVFENVKFNQLQSLGLNNNKIQDINVFKNVKFYNLQSLGLDNNNISDINVLEKVKFYQLKCLGLSGNNISDISVLDNVKFERLERLNLSGNSIRDISVFEEVKFNNLQLLFLHKNEINLKKYATLINDLRNIIKEFSI